ncbi:MAG: response regulator [Lachnospiraceae bacterium]|nr:response regulator [Lachnospiraceae bacterium]
MPDNDTKNISSDSTRVSPLEMLKWYGIKKAIIFPIMALFFILIIIVYHMLLLNYARDSIITNGELSANRAAEEIELYLSSGLDTIKSASYTLEKMLGEGASHNDVLKYLTEETELLSDTNIIDSTGLYAYIHGEYHDGSGWDPGPAYEATDRPWYIEAKAANGSIALVNPYLDSYSGDIVTTLTRMLSDGDSVVAIDVKLDKIQTIIDTHTNLNRNTVNMVIANNGVVVAHTAQSELGKNYFEESDTLGGTVLKSLSEKPGGSVQTGFDFEYENRNYTAYSIKMSNNWYCISIADSDDIYAPIKMMVWLSISVIILTLVIFAVIMIYTGRKEFMQRRLENLLRSSADIYMSLCEFDLTNNTVTEIKNVNPAISNAVKTVNHNAVEVFKNVMTALPESPTRQAAIDFTDLSNIDERMKDRDITTVEYQSFNDVWVRARLIVSERNADGKVTHVLWMLENITKEKQERDSLINISEQAIAASDAKSAFLSNMSHEIRTPINAVLGMNEMILRESDNEDINYYSSNIKSAGNSLLALINDILDFSKIESGKMEIVPVDYDLSSMINDLVTLISVRVIDKGLELNVNIDPDLPVGLFGDEVRIKQVIANLLTNAAKYTDKGSVTFTISSDKDYGKDDTITLHISVKDTGIGIKKENLKQLFTAFERIDVKKNRNIEGTGLGMAIANNLLLLMGSTLKVESEYGVGSEFSFDLVQTVRSWNHIGDYKTAYKDTAAKAEVYTPVFTTSKGRVLVVDDMAINLVVFKGLLKKTGLEIDTAGGGQEGLDESKKNHYDIMFIDHMMPGLDGVEMLHAIKKDENNPNRDTPAICLTANAVTGAREYYLQEGFDGYLTKPVDPKLLEEIIYRHLSPELLEKT